MDLLDFLHGAGYHRIGLSRSGVGNLHASATVAGRAVSALLDTGGSDTVLSLAIAREFGLPLVATELRGATRPLPVSVKASGETRQATVRNGEDHR